MASYPVSESCPKCGVRRHEKARTEAYIAFVPDRICKDCGTRYTPPTPRWAGGVFALAGLALLGVSGFFVVDHAYYSVGGHFPVASVIGCAIPGIAAVLYGLKHLA